VNLLENPAFQGAVGTGLPAPWREHPEEHDARYTTEPGAIAITVSHRSNGYAWQRPNVAGGTGYRLSARIRTEGDVSAQARLFFADVEGKIIRRAMSAEVTGTCDWTAVSAEESAPAEAVSAIIFLILFSVGDGGTARFSDPELRPVPADPRRTVACPSGAYDVLGPRVPQPPTDGLLLIPRPKRLVREPEGFPLTPETCIIIPPVPLQAHLAAARSINREVQARFGYTLAVVPPAKAPAGNGPVIAIGERGSQPFLAVAAPEIHRLEPAPGPEGYNLLVRPTGSAIVGSSPRGTWLGAQTLCQLIQHGGAALPGLSVCDWPDHPFRGLHFFAWGEAREFLLREVIDVAARFKYNHVVIECAVVNWASRPELHKPRGATRENAAAVVAAAREHLLEPIPLVQSLGHCEWLFRDGANLDICADPETPYAYDPRNPRSYDVILPIIDEAVDLFGARTVHIGHDEVRMRGRFPDPFADLFCRDVDRIAGHLRHRGVDVMLWADEVQAPGFAGHLRSLPPDAIMADWVYQPFRRYTSVDQLHGAGYRTVGATWFHPRAIAQFSRSARDSGALGMLQTTWTGYRAPGVLERELPQYAAQITAAEFFWNCEGYTGPDELPYNPAEIAAAALTRGG